MPTSGWRSRAGGPSGAWRSSRYGEDAIYRDVLSSDWAEDVRVWAHRLAEATDTDAEDYRRRYGGLLAAWAKPGRAMEVLRTHLPGAKARKANKTCVLTIDDDGDITGRTPTGGGSTVVIPIDPKLGSLIRIRRHFIVEILKSAEDI